MPIQDQALRSEQNRHLTLRGRDTFRQAVTLFNSPSLGVQPWWHLLVQKDDGTWTTATFEVLLRYAWDDPGRLELPLDRVHGLVEVRAVERTAMGTGEALDLARSDAAKALVVTDGGELAGLLCVSPLRSGGLAPSDLRRIARDLAASGSKEVRYTDISCPGRVWHDTPRFSVVVRLTLEPSELSAAQEGLEVELSTGDPVHVTLHAPGFEVLNASRQELTLSPGEDSSSVVFDLAPRRRGHHRLSLDFFQGGEHLGTATVAVEVVAHEVAEGQVRAASQRLFREPGLPAPDRVLRIVRDRGDDTLRVSLIREGGSSWEDFEAQPLELDPEQFAGENLRDLKYSSHHTPEAEATQLCSAPSREIDRRLKNLGRNLWRELLPEGFRRLYASERDEWRDGTLLVLSDEPHLPWELIWPYGEGWEDEQPWCLTLRLSRWLRRDSQGNGNARSPGRLCLRSLACLVPTDSGLPAAQEEREVVRGLMRQFALEDASPQSSSWESVAEMLEAGGYDWLHVAAHGTFHAASPDQYAALWLEDGHALAPEDIVGPEIEGHLHRTRPAFFFNACHAGRLGWSLTRLGGWASRLLSFGAGLFLGPLWAVEDGAALEMARTLYGELLAGETAAEACRRARLAARRSGDPSWLAYSLYAHPNARLHPTPSRPTRRGDRPRGR